MAFIDSFKYGDIVSVDVNHELTSTEKDKAGYAVVISGNVINDNLNTVIVCPLIEAQQVTKSRVGATFIPQKVIGSEKDSLVFSLQIKTISKDRIVKRIGSLPANYMHQVKESLQAVLDLDD